MHGTTLRSLFVLLATSSFTHARPFFNIDAAATGASVAAVEVTEERPLNANHPALGYASPAVLSSSRSSNGGTESAENSDARFLGSRMSVEAMEKTLNMTFEMINSKLPRSGVVSVTPWPGDYFPTFRDGINFKWDGETSQSPVQKYASAFNLDPVQLADSLSLASGVDSARSFRPPCTQDIDCASLKDGSVCARREGQTTGGLCIPTWFGICHAWAPAAILEPEPKCPVTLNNVTFQVNDIKALITQMYDASDIGTVFGGGRCNEVQPSVDENGRYRRFECRDLTPDFFHVAITNMMGTRQISFVADVDSLAEVWNQPVRSFNIIQNKPITLEQGAKLINPALTNYTFNPMATNLTHIITRFSYIVESRQDGPLVSTGIVDTFTRTSTYEYLLELDADGRIIGGEWVGESKSKHPDFLWLPLGTPTDDTTVAGGITYKNVKDILTRSVNAQC
ncbi:hypothetical protein HK102_011010 [Quaeritorhiza haematococci]|nr:hypothetical protein HK102_011010 [Quaeritorhiza haematococci]